jgi:hypothetical protein
VRWKTQSLPASRSSHATSRFFENVDACCSSGRDAMRFSRPVRKGSLFLPSNERTVLSMMDGWKTKRMRE